MRKTTSAGWRDYIFELGGRPVAEVNANGWQVGYIYLGGSFLAQYSSSTTYFVLSDHLGSTRLMTGVSGGVQDSMDYLPFGEQIAGGTLSPHKFTGKERDAESGLDNFGARYDSSTLGRFMTPDWAAKPTTVPYASFGDPQTLNLYSYVENAPVNRADADGHTGLGAADAGWVSAPEVLHGSAYGSPADETSVTDFDSSLNAGFGFANVDGQFQQVVAGQVVSSQSQGEPGPSTSNGVSEDTSLKQKLKNFLDSPETRLAAGTIAPEGDMAEEGISIISKIGKDPKLVKYAEEAGRSVQKGLDNLVEQLSKGNTNPGLGTKSIGKGISYARARDGARVFFRQADGQIEILAKASKANEQSVINYLKSIY